MRRLVRDRMIDKAPSREHALVVAMVAGRIIAPRESRLGMTQAWAHTTPADDLRVANAGEDEIYEAWDPARRRGRGREGTLTPVEWERRSGRRGTLRLRCRSGDPMGMRQLTFARVEGGP